jgi:hypothetical protein
MLQEETTADPGHRTATPQPERKALDAKSVGALIRVIVLGGLVIAGIGFVGSYTAVQDLAAGRGFGAFSYAFPVGVDVGIVVLLALDLWFAYEGHSFKLLRRGAWLLTAATIVFNAASGWPANTPVTLGHLAGNGVTIGMHAIIPVLFIIVVEAVRYRVARVAAIEAGRHMEDVRFIRWILAPVATFRLWRRMRLWEMRSYEETIQLEQRRMVYRQLLKHEYGRLWRMRAPAADLLPLRLSRYGTPLPLLAAPETEFMAMYAVREPVAAAPAGDELEAPGTASLPVEAAPAASVPALDAPAEPVQQQLPSAEPVQEEPQPVLEYAEPQGLADVDQEPLPVYEPPYPAPVAPAADSWSYQPQQQVPAGWVSPQEAAAQFVADGDQRAFGSAVAADALRRFTEGVAAADASAPASTVALDVHRPGVSVPMQRPEPQDLADVDQEPLEAVEATEALEVQEPVSKKAALAALYPTLSEELQAMSAPQLAEILAPKIGVTPGTCRKYIEAFRQGKL